jgi:hypothetical protein
MEKKQCSPAHAAVRRSKAMSENVLERTSNLDRIAAKLCKNEDVERWSGEGSRLGKRREGLNNSPFLLPPQVAAGETRRHSPGDHTIKSNRQHPFQVAIAWWIA